MRPMELSEKQKKHLRRLAHPLHPLVMLGNAGLTDGVVNELERALSDHELVKVSARVGDRDARNSALATLAARTSAQLVQRIGHVGVFFPPSPRTAENSAARLASRGGSAGAADGQALSYRPRPGNFKPKFSRSVGPS